MSGLEMLFKQITGCCTALVIVSMTLMLTGCLDGRQDRIDRLIHQGDLEFGRRNFDRAIELWQRALRQGGARCSLLIKIGDGYRHLARFKMAETTYREALEEEPQAWRAWLEIGKIKLLMFQLDDAAEIAATLDRLTVTESDVFMFRGDLNMLANDYFTAEMDYRKALDLDPGRPDAIIRLALNLHAQKRVEQAETIIEGLSHHQLHDPHALIQLAGFYRLRNDLERADNCVLKALNEEPEDLQLLLTISDYYQMTGNLNKAETILAAILEQTPNDADIKRRYASILLDQRKIEPAGMVLKTVQELSPNDPETQRLVGQYHLMKNEPILAISYFKNIVDGDLTIPSAHYLLGIAYLANGLNQLGLQSLIRALSLAPDFQDAEIALAGYYFMTGDYDKSSAHASRLVEKAPQNDRALMLSGACSLAMGHYADAENAFKNAIQVNPDQPSNRYFLARTYEITGKIDAATKEYHGLLAGMPCLVDVMEQLKKIYVDAQRKDEAKQLLDQILVNEPDCGYAHYLTGELYLLDNDAQNARIALERAIAADTHLLAAYTLLADLLIDERNRSAAVSVLEEGIANLPGVPSIALRLAKLYMEDGRLQQALQILEQSLAVNPENCWLANNLAALCLDLDVKTNRAFDLARQVYATHPENEAFADTLGWAYFKRGLFHQAVDYLTEAEKGLETGHQPAESQMVPFETLSEHESWATVKFHLGMALMKSGNIGRGRQKLMAAIASGLDGRTAHAATLAIRSTYH